MPYKRKASDLYIWLKVSFMDWPMGYVYPTCVYQSLLFFSFDGPASYYPK